MVSAISDSFTFIHDWTSFSLKFTKMFDMVFTVLSHTGLGFFGVGIFFSHGKNFRATFILFIVCSFFGFHFWIQPTFTFSLNYGFVISFMVLLYRWL